MKKTILFICLLLGLTGFSAADSANDSQVLGRCSDRDICIDLCLDELGAPEPYPFWNCVNSCLSKIKRSDCDD